MAGAVQVVVRSRLLSANESVLVPWQESALAVGAFDKCLRFGGTV